MRRGSVRKPSMAKLAAKVKYLARHVKQTKQPVVHAFKSVNQTGQGVGAKFGTMGTWNSGSGQGLVDLSNANGMVHAINMQDLNSASAIFGPPNGWDQNEKCIIKTCKLRIRIDMNDVSNPQNDQRRVQYQAFHVKLRKRCDLTENAQIGGFLYASSVTGGGLSTFNAAAGAKSFDFIDNQTDNGTYWVRVGGKVVLNPEYFSIIRQDSFEVGPSFALTSQQAAPTISGAVMGTQDRTYKRLFYQSKPQTLRQTGIFTPGQVTNGVGSALVNEVPSKNQFILIFSDDDRDFELRQNIQVLKEFIVQTP